ncbi:(2Fe-2S)-binding protein [Kitasatospora camelliae]|uniref:(2Fe-2S)-binding protein n=1 Tax=Kitasatospora camelliae TaxID=3156397 RepID=A0AAU8K0T6_9ACTN
MLQLTEARACAADELAETYRLLGGICSALDLDLVESVPAAGPSWVRSDQLALHVEELIAGEAARILAEHGTRPRPHVIASRVLHHYLWSACLLVSGPWYLTGQVPDLRSADLWTDPATGRTALRPGASRAGDERDVRDTVAAHVGPVLAAFQPYVKRGPRALWGMAADDLVSGIWYLGRMLDQEDRAVAAAGAVLPGDTAPFPGAAAFRRLTAPDGRTHWTRTRLGCCLYYAVKPDADACITCPRTPDPTRLTRLEADR